MFMRNISLLFIFFKDKALKYIFGETDEGFFFHDLCFLGLWILFMVPKLKQMFHNQIVQLLNLLGTNV